MIFYVNSYIQGLVDKIHIYGFILTILVIHFRINEFLDPF